MIVGDVIVLEFPFSDLSGSKPRPAVVVAMAGSRDYVVCQITSQGWDRDAIELSKADFVFGGLRWPRHVRPGKLFTAAERLVVKRSGRLTAASIGRLKEAVIEVIEG